MNSEEKLSAVLNDETFSAEKLVSFAHNYNLLRIMSGISGLSYSSDEPIREQKQEDQKVEPEEVREEIVEKVEEDEDYEIEYMDPSDLVVQI